MCVCLKTWVFLWQVSESFSKIIVELQAAAQKLKHVWGEHTWEKPKLLKRLLNCQHKGKAKWFEQPRFFSLKGKQKKPNQNKKSFTLHFNEQNVLTSYLQPEGLAKYGHEWQQLCMPMAPNTTPTGHWGGPINIFHKILQQSWLKAAKIHIQNQSSLVETLTPGQQLSPMLRPGLQRCSPNGSDGTELTGVSCTSVQVGTAPLSHYCFHYWNALQLMSPSMLIHKPNHCIFKWRESCTTHSSSGFLQLVLISSQELKQAEAGLLKAAWCCRPPVPLPNYGTISPPAESAVSSWIPTRHARRENPSFAVASLLASIAGSQGSTYLNTNLAIQKFLQHWVSNHFGKELLDKF